MKLVYPAALILRSFLEDPAVPRYGIEFMGGLGVSSGALYPILRRLEAEGLLCAEWERIDPHEQERPARRYYRLTPDGEQFARRELAALADRLRPPRPVRQGGR